MVADAIFGTDEEIEKGRKRLRENADLVRRFLPDSFQWWSLAISRLLGRKEVPQEEEGDDEKSIGTELHDMRI